MREQEFKSLLSKDKYEEIKKKYDWDNQFSQTNHYYSDDEGYILKNEITVRVREKNDSYKLQVKVPESIQSNIHIKNEFSRPFESVPKVIDKTVLNDLYGFEIGDVHKIGELKTERCTKRINDSIELFLDKNEYLNTTDYEVEIEYLNDETEIENIVNELGIDKSTVTYGKKTRFVRELISGNK